MRFLASLSVSLLLSAATPAKLSIHVMPTVLMEGAAIRIKCQVPLDANNRLLQVAIDGYRYSQVPIEGDRGPVTTEITYAHVPCDVSEVSCTVVTSTGRSTRVSLPLEVVCRG